jgi:hypothetical protein
MPRAVRPSPRPDEAALIRAAREATGAREVELGARIQSLWGGYGEILRVELEGCAAQSAILKYVAPPALASESRDARVQRSHRRKLRSYEVELAFYERYAARGVESCRVPHAYRAQKTQSGALFVLEDLDAAGYSARRSTPSETELHDCLRWLASFHAAFLGTTPDGLWPTGTYWHLATRPDELALLRDAALRKAAPYIDARLRSASYRTFVHGDAKIDNFCFRPSASGVAAVDYQYVGGGVGVQDVAYFLDSCLTPERCERTAPELLDVYFAELHEALSRRATRAEVSDGTLPDPDAVEAEWRTLYPFARVDFHRFLLGWAPGSYDGDPYAQRLTCEVLAALEAERRAPRSP